MKMNPSRVLAEMRDVGLAATEFGGVEALLAGYDAARAGTLVLSADSGGTGYDSRPELDADGWSLLVSNLDRIAAYAATRGVTAVLHPNVGTMVETGDDLSLARRVQDGRLSYTEAVAKGMYRPLGDGDVDIDGVLTHLRARGYDGWYVLEQDTILHGPPVGEGPAADVHRSVENLRRALAG